MKQKSTKILAILIVLILVIGAIVIATKGLAFELKYQNGKQIEINLGKEFEKKDMEEITKEVGKEKIEVVLAQIPEELEQEVKDYSSKAMLEAIQIKDKLEKYAAIDKVKADALIYFE